MLGNDKDKLDGLRTYIDGKMKFYLARPRNIYMWLEVTDVQEYTSEAFVMMATFTDYREAEVKPKVGW